MKNTHWQFSIKVHSNGQQGYALIIVNDMKVSKTLESERQPIIMIKSKYVIQDWSDRLNTNY